MSAFNLSSHISGRSYHDQCSVKIVKKAFKELNQVYEQNNVVLSSYPNLKYFVETFKEILDEKKLKRFERV